MAESHMMLFSGAEKLILAGLAEQRLARFGQVLLKGREMTKGLRHASSVTVSKIRGSSAQSAHLLRVCSSAASLSSAFSLCAELQAS